MRTMLITLVSLVLAATAYAAPVWTTPSWYKTLYTEVGLFLWHGSFAGPFADETSCRANLPPDDNEIAYGCEYLAERPDWDE